MTASDRRSRVLFIVALTAGVAVLRIGLAARIPLTDDEAYYWLWSRHLAWGYPDHPPMIAGLIAIARAFAGDGAFAIRTLTVLLTLLMPPLLYAAGRDLFDAASGVRAAVIASILPIAALGPALAVPDTPLSVFWVLAVWSGWRAMRYGGSWWLATGAAVALALMTKLPALFLPLGLVGAWLTGPRRGTRDPFLYAGIGLGLLLVAPLFIWNATHDWSTFTFAFHSPSWFAPRSVGENLLLFLGGQLLYHGPAAAALIAAVIVAVRRPAPSWRYVAWMSVPLLATVLLSAAGARAKPHWPSPAYLTAALALGALWPEWSGPRRKLGRAAVWATGALTLVIAAAALLPLGLDVDGVFGRWDQLARAAGREVRARGPGRSVFILTDGYQAASQIAYALKDRVVVTPMTGVFVHWWFPREVSPIGIDSGMDLVYVEMDRAWTDRLSSLCAQVVKGKTFVVAPGREATLYVCVWFRGFL